MSRSLWVSMVIVATTVSNGLCRPQEIGVKNIYPVYRGEKEVRFETPNSSYALTKERPSVSATTNDLKTNIEAIATVARASSGAQVVPSSPNLGQLVDAVNQMVESDIRTPPKLKEIIKEKTKEAQENSTPLPYTFVYDDSVIKIEGQTTDKSFLADLFEGKASSAKISEEGVKGIAIPVVMDDDYESPTPPKKLQKIPEVPKPVKQDKKNQTKPQLTTTPSSGLSTWILLSDNKDVTTPFPKKNNNNNNKNDEKKKTTTKNSLKVQTTTQKSTAKKTTTKRPEIDTTSVLEGMVKKKGVTTVRPKPEEVKTTKKPTDVKKKTPDRLEVSETKNKVEVDVPAFTVPASLPITEAKESSQVTENPADGGTKKKSSTKKKKKNKNRRRKPAEESGLEPKIPTQPVGSQIYNFLSREIVPTVGLGLIGVALTAGLASFLGYNPFAGTAIPLRRTYDTHHGYSSNNYYNYNTDYGDGGQSEEVLFREVLSGMPEDSRYGLTHADTYSELYSRQEYENGPTYQYPEKDGSSYDSYSQEYSTAYSGTRDTQDKGYGIDKNKHPVYNREPGGTSFVYPDTTPKAETIERQPEALYRVASEPDLQYRSGESAVQGISSQNSWHRIGAPVDAKPKLLEPGPRNLDLTKEVKKRSKRESVIQRISPKRTKKQNNIENEVDFEDAFSDNRISEDFSTITTTPTTTVTTATSAAVSETSTTTTTASPEETKDASSESAESYDEETTAQPPTPLLPQHAVSVMDVLKRLAQFKLRLGLNFLRSTTDLFSRYLDDIQKRVDESFVNTTTTAVQYNRRKSPWSRIFSRDEVSRRKRSALEDKLFLSPLLTDVDANTNHGLSKSTKKDLRESDKIFHQKKNSPKKYERKRGN